MSGRGIDVPVETEGRNTPESSQMGLLNPTSGGPGTLSDARDESPMLDDEQDELIDDEDVGMTDNDARTASTTHSAAPIVLPPASILDIPRAPPRDSSVQSKKARRPISKQQFNMMNTFKIRPPSALEMGANPLNRLTPKISGTPSPLSGEHDKKWKFCKSSRYLPSRFVLFQM